MPSSSSSGGGGYEPIPGVSPGWNYLGVVRLGNNSTTGSVWELCVGADTQSNCSTADQVWGTATPSGVNSGWVNISLRVSLIGSGSTGVLEFGNVSASYSQGAYSSISEVEIQALADGVKGSLKFQSICAVFSHPGGVSETVNVPDSSAPEGNNSSGSGTASQSIKISPFGGNYTVVEITAQVRLISLEAGLPAPDSLKGGIYVYTS